MTGKLLCARFAAPCGYIRQDLGKLDGVAWLRVVERTKRGLETSAHTLQYCFPEMFKGLRTLARATGRETFSLENVAEYWRERHVDRPGDCRVQVVRVVANDHPVLAEVSTPDRGFVVIKYYPDVEVRVGDLVRIHQRCIIEKVGDES
ncbi:MAG TPA: hypothetical protein VMC43_00240 [Candidatus Paceibacterota bacterium]|nr:hypothetical protein [Candidatus Paceibacterota bacterium]